MKRDKKRPASDVRVDYDPLKNVEGRIDPSISGAQEISKGIISTIRNDIKNNPQEYAQLLLPLFENPIPTISVSSPSQSLNLRNDITYRVVSHIGCLKPELLPEIHSIFHNNALTGTCEEDFIPHMMGGETKARKIMWLKGINLLTFSFIELMEKIFPYYDDPFRVIAEHFCDAEGNDLTADKLRKSHSKGIQKISKMEMIRKLFLSVIKR